MQTAQNESPEIGTTAKKSRKTWHYTPPLPLRESPYFNWPINILAILKWMIAGWFPLKERMIILLISIASVLYLHPALERCRALSIDWIAGVYFRNLGLMLLVAGGLHLYFYTFKRQDDKRQYDKRPFITNNKYFTFKSQVADNLFWSLASGVTIWTAYEVLMLWSLVKSILKKLKLAT